LSFLPRIADPNSFTGIEQSVHLWAGFFKFSINRTNKAGLDVSAAPSLVVIKKNGCIAKPVATFRPPTFGFISGGCLLALKQRNGKLILKVLWHGTCRR